MADALFDITGRSVLIAGGAGGLGVPLARALARRGARLVIADVDADSTQRIANDLRQDGGELHGCALDVLDEGSCEAAVAVAVERFGRLDVLLNASGIYRIGPALELDRRDWDRTIDVNLTGAFVLARAAGRRMIAQGGGRIINLASVSSMVINPEYAAYAASKAGVAHLTRILALEWARHGVTVNAIGPALTATPFVDRIMSDETRRSAALARIPMGRFGTPDDIEGVVVFLASAAGAFVTGQTIYVDGGRTIG